MSQQGRPSSPPGLAGLHDTPAGKVLLAQRCRHCRHVCFPRGEMCPPCGATDLDDLPLAGTGQVFSWTRVHRAAAGWRVPYLVAWIDVPEGPRLFGQVEAEAASMRVGLPVRVRFGQPPAGRPDPAYFFAADSID